jgi:hypothetical protein
MIARASNSRWPFVEVGRPILASYPGVPFDPFK